MNEPGAVLRREASRNGTSLVSPVLRRDEMTDAWLGRKSLSDLAPISRNQTEVLLLMLGDMFNSFDVNGDGIMTKPEYLTHKPSFQAYAAKVSKEWAVLNPNTTEDGTGVLGLDGRYVRRLSTPCLSLSSEKRFLVYSITLNIVPYMDDFIEYMFNETDTSDADAKYTLSEWSTGTFLLAAAQIDDTKEVRHVEMIEKYDQCRGTCSTNSVQLGGCENGVSKCDNTFKMAINLMTMGALQKPTPEECILNTPCERICDCFASKIPTGSSVVSRRSDSVATGSVAQRYSSSRTWRSEDKSGRESWHPFGDFIEPQTYPPHLEHAYKFFQSKRRRGRFAARHSKETRLDRRFFFIIFQILFAIIFTFLQILFTIFKGIGGYVEHHSVVFF